MHYTTDRSVPNTECWRWDGEWELVCRGCEKRWLHDVERLKAYRIADADEIIHINNTGRTRRGHDGLYDLGDLVLGGARHDGGWLVG